jgi:hypothetical protein
MRRLNWPCCAHPVLTYKRPYGAKLKDTFHHTRTEQCPFLPHILFAATIVPRVMVCFLVLGINCDSKSRCVAWGNSQQTMLILFSHARASLYLEPLSLGLSDETFSIKKRHRRFTLFTFLLRDLETKAPSTRTFQLCLRPEDSDHL